MKHAECGGAAAGCVLCKWTEQVEGIVSGVLAGQASPQLRRKWAGGIVVALVEANELRPPWEETDAQAGEPRPVEVVIRDQGEGVEFNAETGELRAIQVGPELVEPAMGPAPAVESNAIGPAMSGAIVKDEGLGVVLDSRTGDLLPVKRVRADGTWELGEPAGEATVAPNAVGPAMGPTLGEPLPTGEWFCFSCGKASTEPPIEVDELGRASSADQPEEVVVRRFFCSLKCHTTPSDDPCAEIPASSQSEGDKAIGRIENSIACFESAMSRELVAHREFVVAVLLDAIPTEEEEPEPEPTPDERAVLALDRLQPEMAERYLLGRGLVLGGPRPIKTRRQAREVVILLANLDGRLVEDLVREIVEAFDVEQEQAKPGISIAQVHDYLFEKGWQQEGPETYQLQGVGIVSADERLEKPALVGELVHQIARLEGRTMSQVLRDLPDRKAEADESTVGPAGSPPPIGWGAGPGPQAVKRAVEEKRARELGAAETCAGCRWLEVEDDEGPAPSWRCEHQDIAPQGIPFRHARCPSFEWSSSSVPVDEPVAVGQSDPDEWLKRAHSGETKAQADARALVEESWRAVHGKPIGELVMLNTETGATRPATRIEKRIEEVAELVARTREELSQTRERLVGRVEMLEMIEEGGGE